MKLLNWLDALSRTAHPEASPRRAALTQLGRAALAAVPMLPAATAAVAGPPRVTSLITDGLNLPLQVALAQQALLTQGLAATNGANFPSADVRARYETLKTQVDDLVSRLRTSIERSGDTAATPANYDFSGGHHSGSGPLNPLGAGSSFNDFSGLAQALADLLSRTLISVQGPLHGTGTFTELLTQLLATNSRMAALIRRLRVVAPWVSQVDPAGAPAILVDYYDGEANTSLFNLELTSTGANAVLPAPQPSIATITEAFDEPLKLEKDETLPLLAVQNRLALLI